MICHYRYFTDIGYEFEPYVCNGYINDGLLIKKHCNTKCKRC